MRYVKLRYKNEGYWEDGFSDTREVITFIDLRTIKLYLFAPMSTTRIACFAFFMVGMAIGSIFL